MHTSTNMEDYKLQEESDVNLNKTIGRRVRNCIRMGSIERLRKIMSDHPKLNLSRFPGEWENMETCTPIVASVINDKMDMFKFLISCQVSLEVVTLVTAIILPPGQFDNGQVARYFQRGNGNPMPLHGNVLSF